METAVRLVSPCAHCQHSHGGGRSGHRGFNQPVHLMMPQKSTSQGDSPQGGVSSGPLPCRSTPVSPYPTLPFGVGSRQTGPGRGLPQREPRSQVAAQQPRLLKPQHSGPQHQPTTHHSLAVSEMSTMEKRIQPWAAYGQNCKHLHGGVQRFVVITWALASVVTSFGGGLTLRGSGA